MIKGVFRLKSRQLYVMKLLDKNINVRELSDRSGLAYGTAYRWVNQPEKISAVDLNNLTHFLIGGLGYTPEEALELRLKDVFEYIPESEKDVTLHSTDA